MSQNDKLKNILIRKNNNKFSMKNIEKKRMDFLLILLEDYL